MKWILSLFVLAAANLPAFANDLELNTNPDSPMVIEGDTYTTDGRLVTGPWFKTEYEIVNKSAESITIASIFVDVTAAATGHKKSYNFPVFPIYVKPGSSDVTPVFYPGELPPNAGSFVYRVHVRASGWAGAYRDSAKRVNLETEFLTR